VSRVIAETTRPDQIGERAAEVVEQLRNLLVDSTIRARSGRPDADRTSGCEAKSAPA
jgi:hypothetical protein